MERVRETEGIAKGSGQKWEREKIMQTTAKHCVCSIHYVDEWETEKNSIETLNESHAFRTSYVCDSCSPSISLSLSRSFTHSLFKVLLLKSCCSCCLGICFGSEVFLLLSAVLWRWERECVCTTSVPLLNALFNCVAPRNFSECVDVDGTFFFISFYFFVCILFGSVHCLHLHIHLYLSHSHAHTHTLLSH